MVSTPCIAAPPFVVIARFFDFKTGKETSSAITNVLSQEALDDYNRRHPLTDAPTPHYQMTGEGRVMIVHYYTNGVDGAWSNESKDDPRRFSTYESSELEDTAWMDEATKATADLSSV